jgi:exopolysaccharide biosynthesis polyprenyl glycosylphosphotransferase
MDRYCPYLGTPEEIGTYLTIHNIHEMIIALDVHEHDKLLDIIGEFNTFDININIIPDMYEAISGQVSVDIIRGLPLLNINPDIMTEFQEIYKRAIDLCICIIALIMLFPVNLLIAIIIRITSPGKILYKQIRVGLNGTQFTLIKFRTMYDNSEDNTGPIWSDKEDNRITGPGKILRKYHLDEIPQLLNVLYGTMSIIGPRPERPEIIENLMKNISYYSRRFKVKPGLTGWAQIMGVYDVSVADVHNKLKHDFYYIENMSIFLDIKILILTLFAVLRGKGR